MRHDVTREFFRRRLCEEGYLKRAEDINVDGDGQSILAPADRVASVGCDLNYLRGEENVTSGEV